MYQNGKGGLGGSSTRRRFTRLVDTQGFVCIRKVLFIISSKLKVAKNMIRLYSAISFYLFIPFMIQGLFLVKC